MGREWDEIARAPGVLLEVDGLLKSTKEYVQIARTV